MSRLSDLIAKIENPELRAQIEEAANQALKQKKFGLVFEEHLPECTPLYGVPVRKGKRVSLKSGKVSETYTVLKIDGDKAICLPKDSKDAVELAVADLVVTAEFGEPIYPCLQPLGEVCNAPDSDLWHTLIEADNYHALQLLEYLYAGKVDCIYIDPPYNTGARDWKYNNDYVDGNDEYRHSKWLSFIKKRLEIAKKLLNPNDSVLIITIDEKEYLHLGCLLEEMFSDANIQMVTSVINPKGTPKLDYFARVEEYIFFIWIGEARPVKTVQQMLGGEESKKEPSKVRWASLQRSGGQSRRIDTEVKFYPIFLDPDTGDIIRVGDHVDQDFDISNVIPNEGEMVQWPIKSDGTEGCWQVSDDTLRLYLSQGRVQIGTKNKKTGRWTLNYLMGSDWDRVQNGEIEVLGKDKHGALILGESLKPSHAKTVWHLTSHSATDHGTSLLKKFFPDNRFSYPKSIYAVQDTIRFFVANKPNALIVDFFAGSGTTLHAVNLLNAEDGGNRRCIMVTNNEISAEERKGFEARGIQQGDPEWEARGIARHVTWPRTVCSIEGHDVNGNPLKGNYIGSDRPMADGFAANAAFFKLGFLDKTKVSLGMQFKELLSTLWMKAGAIGKCPVIDASVPDMLILPDNKMAILTDENRFGEFAQQLAQHPEIEVVYLVTDYESSYVAMTQALEGKTTYQLYRDYLDNFRINAGRNSR